MSNLKVERPEIPLSETTKFIVDNRGKTAPTEASGIPLIATNCINNKDLYPIYENIRFVSQDTYDNWFRAHPKAGDILLTLKGSQNGAVCLAPDPVDFVIAQDMVALRANEEVIDPLFLFAALRSPDVQTQIKNLDVSGVIPHLKKTDFNKLILPYPDRATQQLIGKIYFDFSKKIDLLHRQNQTLEALAETLFRQWFVEQAQEDWQDGCLADFANHMKVNVNPGSNPLNTYTHYSLPAFDQGMRPVVELGGEILSNKYGVEPWTILVSKLNPRFPRIWPIGIQPGENAICSTEFQVFKPKNQYMYGYLYFLLKSKEAREELTMSASGTSGSHQRVRPEDILNLRISLPSGTLAETYSETVMPNIIKLMENLEQIRSLEKLRDILLPKLMSGEVRVAI